MDRGQGRAGKVPTAVRPPVPRPLVGLTLVFILGILCGLRWATPVPLLLGLAVLLLAAFFFVRRRGNSTFFLYLALFLLGFAHLRLAAYSPSPRDLAGQLAGEAEYLHLEAEVIGEPVEGRSPDPGSMSYRLPVRVIGVSRVGPWQRASGIVDCRWRTAPRRVPAYGERWVLTGLLKQPDAALRGSNRFRCRMEMDDRETYLVSQGHGARWVTWCLEGRRACASMLAVGLEDYPEHTGLLQALLLGYRSELPSRLYTAFSQTGTLHIFAISGLHVGVMSLLLVGVLRASGVPRQYWILYLAPLLLIYVVATGMKTSAVRAMVMACVYWLAPLLGRKPDAATALPFAALLILSFAPTQVADAGFLLSFTVVAGLVVLVPRLLRPLEFLRQPDPWMAMPNPWYKRWLRSGAMAVASLAAVSLAAWISSAPLTAYFFNQFSPVALVGNILVVPLAFLVVFCGCLSLICGSGFLLLAEVFNHANRVFVSVLLSGIEALVKVPGGHRFVVAPPVEWVLLWYGLLVAVLLVKQWRTRLAVAAIGVALMVGGITYAQAKAEPRLDVIDVDDGLALLLDIPWSPAVLIDAGPAYYARRVVNHLKQSGVNRLRALVLTHADARHVGGAMEVMRSFAVDEVWRSPDPGRSRVYHAVLEEAKARNIPLRMLQRGERGALRGNIMWEVLHPPLRPAYTSANNASLVLRLGRGGWSALVMGGAGGVVERELLECPLTLAATDLVVGNDPDPANCSEAWLRAVGPTRAIISASGRHPQGFPASAVRDRLEASGARLLRTDRQDTVGLSTSVPSR